MRKLVVLGAALFAATFAAYAGVGAQETAPVHAGPVTLPAGPELLALQNSCEACHSLNMVTQQRLSAATWKAEVTKMRGFGAPLKAAQEPAVVAYLARYLGPTAPRTAVRTTATAPPITYGEPPRP
ncbi:MAG TPA: cytochrome C [Candidatus Limnocylindria bacterium]|jgi:hypothetical protein|nr:cytochrome C [Candidatus Limnocylindria bacterium]